MLAMTPLRIESRAELGADGALLDDVQLDRQPARAQRDGELVGGLDGEAAARSAALPPRIGSLMFGAEMTTLSRMIANGLPTFSWVTRAKRWLPAPSKRMLTTGRAVARIEVLRGVGDLVAGDHRAALDGDARRRPPSA